MRKLAVLFGMCAILTWAALAFAVSPENPKMSLNPGDEVYACACGEKCPCDSMSKTAAKCACGKDMVKGKVVGVDDDKVVVSLDGKERGFKTVGKYVCACGEKCPCDYVSQNPGKCGCGKDLVPAKGM